MIGEKPQWGKPIDKASAVQGAKSLREQGEIKVECTRNVGDITERDCVDPDGDGGEV